MTGAKAARSWGVPITVLLGHRPADGQWVSRDSLVALALQQYEDSIHSCGVPSAIAFGDHNIERVEWRETVCHACESKEAAITDKTRNEYPGKIIYPHWDDLDQDTALTR